MSRFERNHRPRADSDGRIDCDRCAVRGIGCGDCVVSILLGPPTELDLAPDERAALDVLAGAGLVPPLRQVQPVEVSGEYELWGDPSQWQEPSSRQSRRQSG